MPKGKADFGGLAQHALSRSRELVEAWFPGGKMVTSKEYAIGNLAGDAGQSLKINVLTGEWSDFASAEVGGDLISLYAAIHGIKQIEAYRKLADEMGFQGSIGPRAVPNSPPAGSASIGRPPVDAKPPSYHHPRHGTASKTWTYLDTDGSVICHTSRHDPPGEKKQIIPWSWDKDKLRWVMKGQPRPHPIFGLDQLVKYPNKNVLIVEGEKPTIAAREICKEDGETTYIVISWMGGTGQVKLTDWRLLRGRNVLLWPDADRHVVKNDGQMKTYSLQMGDTLPYKAQDGPKAMIWLAGHLVDICMQVKLLDVGIDMARIDGWDAADALDEGWDWGRIKSWAAGKVEEVKKRNATDIDQKKKDLANAKLEVDPDVYETYTALGLALRKGIPLCNMDNVVRVLDRWEKFKGKIWFDEFHDKVFTDIGDKRKAWTDVDNMDLVVTLQRELEMTSIKFHDVEKAVIKYSRHDIRDEPREWMESLKWNGVERLGYFFEEYFGTPRDEYHMQAGVNFFIGMVARVFQPGCKLDNMIVLEGSEGRLKSTAIEIISDPWFATVHDQVTNKDFFLALTGKLCLEINEMDSFTNKETSKVKAVISTATDRYRSPYGHISEDHPRRSVFVGTTNEDEWGKSQTGARRFWPIRVKHIELKALKEDRDQLFAEAVHRFKAGEEWWEMPEEATKAQQEERRQRDAWEDIVASWLAALAFKTTSIEAVARGALQIDDAKLDKMCQNRIRLALKRSGWMTTMQWNSDLQRSVRQWVPKHSGEIK